MYERGKVNILLLFFEQDLGSSGGPPRNWKGIGIAMVVILGVMSLVTLSIFLLTPGKTEIGGINDYKFNQIKTKDKEREM